MHILFMSGAAPIDVSFAGKTLSPALTFTRSSPGTRFNSSGVIEAVAPNAPRFDHDPLTLQFSGLLIEEQRTNLLTNSILAGASAPSTRPTNWTQLASQGGIAETIIGTGVEYGMNYVDIRYSGTASDTTSTLRWFSSNGETSALYGQTQTLSMYARLVGGSKNNFSAMTLSAQEYNGSSTVGVRNDTTSIAGLSASLARYSKTYTTAQSNVTQIRWGYRLVCTNGSSCDITIRFYQPQQEVGTAVTSPIVTSGAAVLRAADQLSFTIPKGTTSLTYVFDDDSTQSVSVSSGTYIVPTNLNRTRIKRITSG